MINSNPETVSTDFDASSRLYFEPLDPESVRSVIDAESAGHAEGLDGPSDGTDLLPAVVAYNVLSKKVDTIDGNVQSITKHITAFMKAQRRTERTAVRSVSMMEEAS